MTTTPISTHEADALARLLEQYKDSTKLRGLVSALTVQIQELEDTLNAVESAHGIAAAMGDSLDRIGDAVGFARPAGTSDATYRLLILGKIGLNVSQGETERVIDVYRLLTQASTVYLEEFPVAALSIFSDGTVATGLVDTVRDFLDDVVAAGVAVLYFGLYDFENPFVFAGDASGSGFGDATDATVGGKLAQLLIPVNP